MADASDPLTYETPSIHAREAEGLVAKVSRIFSTKQGRAIVGEELESIAAWDMRQYLCLPPPVVRNKRLRSARTRPSVQVRNLEGPMWKGRKTIPTEHEYDAVGEKQQPTAVSGKRQRLYLPPLVVGTHRRPAYRKDADGLVEKVSKILPTEHGRSVIGEELESAAAWDMRHHLCLPPTVGGTHRRSAYTRRPRVQARNLDLPAGKGIKIISNKPEHDTVAERVISDSKNRVT